MWCASYSSAPAASPSSCPVVHSRHTCGSHARNRGDLTRGKLKHTPPFGWRSENRFQLSRWVQMGLDAATGRCSGASTTLGGTLMDEVDLAQRLRAGGASSRRPDRRAHAAGRPGGARHAVGYVAPLSAAVRPAAGAARRRRCSPGLSQRFAEVHRVRGLRASREACAAASSSHGSGLGAAVGLGPPLMSLFAPSPQAAAHREGYGPLAAPDETDFGWRGAPLAPSLAAAPGHPGTATGGPRIDGMATFPTPRVASCSCRPLRDRGGASALRSAHRATRATRTHPLGHDPELLGGLNAVGLALVRGCEDGGCGMRSRGRKPPWITRRWGSSARGRGGRPAWPARLPHRTWSRRLYRYTRRVARPVAGRREIARVQSRGRVSWVVCPIPRRAAAHRRQVPQPAQRGEGLWLRQHALPQPPPTTWCTPPTSPPRNPGGLRRSARGARRCCA